MPSAAHSVRVLRAHGLAVGSVGAALALTILLHDWTQGSVFLRVGAFLLLALLVAELSERRQRRSEARLRESEARFRVMSDSAPVMIWMVDADGRCTYVNRAWLEFTGRTLEQELATVIPEALHPADRQRSLDVFGEALAARRTFRVELRLRRHDGVYRWVLAAAAPRFDAQGRLEGYIGSSVDITERKRIEDENLGLLARTQVACTEAEAAQRREAFLATASSALATSLDYDATLASVARLAVPFLADWCSVDVLEADGSIRRVAAAHAEIADPELARAVATLPADREGRHPRTRVLRTGRAQLTPEVSDVDLEAGAPSAAHLRVMRELGYRSAMIVPLTVRGHTIGVVNLATAQPGRRYGAEDLALAEELARRAALAVDNARLYREAQEAIAERERALAQEQTVRVEAEDARVEAERARAEAEAASRAKDDFLATLSHELRSPLSAILTWAFLLRTKIADPAEAARAIEAIERNTRLQARLVEDLLDISRIVSGRLGLEVSRVELPSVIEAAVEAARPVAEARGLHVEVALDAAVPPVRGDPMRLQQVVGNLLSNAIKFTPEGGRISVTLGRTGADARLTVRDTGSGIPAELLPQVFDRFRQADSSSTRRHGGLGLGLAIVRHLVELHGGSVAVMSAGAGQGTTLTITLPLDPNLELAASEASRGGPRLADLADLDGVRVLVVDDEADAREFIRAILAGCGAEVTAAASAASALGVLRRAQPDVLVSDIAMPDEDGYALVRQVRALGASAGGRVPALALTAYASAEDRQRVLGAGYQMHLAKPVEPADLVAAVAALASGRTRPAPTPPERVH